MENKPVRLPMSSWDSKDAKEFGIRDEQEWGTPSCSYFVPDKPQNPERL